LEAKLLPSIRQFIKEQSTQDRRVVLVTSGRMNVPLERNMVRYIANFSSGGRGAYSTEEFLKYDNYSVIYLHHQSAVRPFDLNSKFSVKMHDIHVTNDCTSVTIAASDDSSSSSEQHRKQLAKLRDDIELYHKVKRENRLLEVQYDTLYEYLVMLSECSKLLDVLKHRAMVFSAAAVADFYVPYQDMSQHKIQSRDMPDNCLQLKLHQTPKCLKALRLDWCPNAFLVSFKLETDPSIINEKVNDAITKYKIDVVLSNLLSTYVTNVHIHYNDYIENREPSHGKLIQIDPTKNERLEAKIVRELVDRHDEFITAHVQILSNQ